ncbi:DUF7710 domain-containing protein [Pimelobacter simplex]|uniref:DUF7710 domain-containing protein n=1 Tax=Nocardioides simplex TaxID=2045 RepID=UPI001933982F|nr:hypothetical protein [Pimelobacter simplex]
MAIHPCDDWQMAHAGTTVWVFHGDDARHASGVFSSKLSALEWVERHRLTGLLTEYPLDVGVYDDAVARGLFKPSRDHHGSPRHIASFSPGRAEHVHLVDGRLD